MNDLNRFFIPIVAMMVALVAGLILSFTLPSSSYAIEIDPTSNLYRVTVSAEAMLVKEALDQPKPASLMDMRLESDAASQNWQPGESAPAGLSETEWQTIQEKIAAARYQVTWQTRDNEWAYRAPNQANDLAVAFATEGFKATHYSDEGQPLWDVGLTLQAYGDQPLPKAIKRDQLWAAKTEIEYRWNERVTE